MRIRVVLPAPFSPSKAWISPGRKLKSTRSLANTVPKRLVIPRIATTGSRSLVISSNQYNACGFQDGTPSALHLGHTDGARVMFVGSLRLRSDCHRRNEHPPEPHIFEPAWL